MYKKQLEVFTFNVIKVTHFVVSLKLRPNVHRFYCILQVSRVTMTTIIVQDMIGAALIVTFALVRQPVYPFSEYCNYWSFFFGKSFNRLKGH